MKYTVNELANSKGVTPLVREAMLQMEAKLNRKWVGLTDEEVLALINESGNFGMGGFICHIEDKLKEKNNE